MSQSPFTHLVEYLRQLLNNQEQTAVQRVIDSLASSSSYQLVERLGVNPDPMVLEALDEAITQVQGAVVQISGQNQESATSYASMLTEDYYRVRAYVQSIASKTSYNDNQSKSWQKKALLKLRAIRNDDVFSINEVCKGWLTSRNPDLEALILEKRWVATSPIRTRIFTMLKLGRRERTWFGQREVKVLVEAAADSDPLIAQNAQTCLWTLTGLALDTLATVWNENPLPLIIDILVNKEHIPSKPVDLRVLVALRTGHGELLTNSRELAPLVQLCESSDPEISKRARECLENLPESSLDSLFNIWAETRQPFLVGIINQRKYLPKKAGPARVLVALQLGQWERIASNGKASVVPTLAHACTDNDPQIAARAQLALAKLAKPEAQQELCRLLIKEELPVAQKIALECGYLPSQAYERALFYFVTEQWDKYEALDFDYRLLHTAYVSADSALRRRLAEKVRAAGRTEFLSVIAGGNGDYRNNAAEMSREEAELLVQILSANAEWHKLWLLVYELPLYWSVQVVQRLAQTGWQPARADESLLFSQLVPLVQQEILTQTEQIEKFLPPAVLRARARATGRINDLVFAPSQALMAVGTGTGKVILWDTQHARCEKKLTGFEHSIGKLAYTPGGTLVCAEKSSTHDATCKIYIWNGQGEPLPLGEHRGPVTAIEAVGAEQILTTGRDCKAKLWDTASHILLRQTELFVYPNDYAATWARGACVSPDASEIALLHEGLSLATLPELNVVSRAVAKEKARCATFSPDGKVIIVGNYTQGVSFYAHQKGNLTATVFQNALENPSWQTGQTQAIAFQSSRNVAVMGKSNGTIHFNDWTKREWLGKVEVQGERLTSLKISPDGFFMAVGDSDASFSLWDLRPLEVRSLFTQALSQARLSQMAALNVLTEPGVLAQFTPKVGAALQFLGLVLRQRFRHDIELDDVPMLEVGDFDIEIEG